MATIFAHNFCALLSNLSLVQSSTHRVPPKVQWEGLQDRGVGSSQSTQWEGPHDRGADYLSPQHCIVFRNKHTFVCQTTAVNPLMFVFTVWPYYSRVNIKDPDGCNT